MHRFLFLAFLALAACEPVQMPAPPPQTQPSTQPPKGDPQSIARQAAQQFIQVVEDVEPIAEAECRRKAPRSNCDFQIVVDDRPNQPPNAFQTVDRAGRPVLAFNLGLIVTVRNADELAFVMGHEAAHHILNHLEQAQNNATVGAVVLSGLAAMTGADAATVRQAQEVGALVGARTYSKDFELEADQLGTLITLKSGYDPVRGAQFFTRIPDPGNKFLGSHPPNAARIDIVRRTAAGASG